MFDTLRQLVPIGDSSKTEPDTDLETVEKLGGTAPNVNNKNAATSGPIKWHPSFGYAEDTDTVFRTYIVDSWPADASEHMFWDLLTDTALEYDMSIQYDRHDRLEAVSMLDELSDRLNDKATGALSRFTLNPESVKRTAQVVDQMKQSLEQGDENLFNITVYITLYAPTKEELEQFHSKLEDRLQLNAGVSIDTTTYEQDIGLRGSSPLGYNEYYDRHGNDVSQLMTGSVAANLFPYVSDTLFEDGGVDFGRNLATNTPTIVDPYSRPTGYHMLRLGRTGSGKTFGASQFLLRLVQSNPNMHIAIIDPMRDFIGVNHALSGDRIVIDGNENINPLEIKETPQHIIDRAEGQINPFSTKLRDVEWFFTRFFSMADDPLDAQQRAILSEAVKKAYTDAGITQDPKTHSKDSPTVTDVREIIADMNRNPEKYAETQTENMISKIRNTSSELAIQLKPFKQGNRYHNLARPTSIDLSGNPITYIDMKAVSARSETLGLMMQLLFSLIYQEAKQVENKYMMAIDEAHKVLRNTDSVAFLEEVFRHGRHFDLGIQLISQTFEEFFKNESAKTIARQCSMVQLHQMERIDEEIAKDAMDLNQKQIEYIKDLQAGDGDKNYSDALLQLSDKGSVPLRVTATVDEKAVIDYDPAKSWRELTEPRSQRIKQALDQRTKHDAPIVDPSDNELSKQVLNEVMNKQQNIQTTLLKNGVDPANIIPEDEKENLGITTATTAVSSAEETHATPAAKNDTSDSDTTASTADPNTVDESETVPDLHSLESTDTPEDSPQTAKEATETTSSANANPTVESPENKAPTQSGPAVATGTNSPDEKNTSNDEIPTETPKDGAKKDTRTTEDGDVPTPSIDNDNENNADIQSEENEKSKTGDGDDDSDEWTIDTDASTRWTVEDTEPETGSEASSESVEND